MRLFTKVTLDTSLNTRIGPEFLAVYFSYLEKQKHAYSK